MVDPCPIIGRIFNPNLHAGCRQWIPVIAVTTSSCSRCIWQGAVNPGMSIANESIGPLRDFLLLLFPPLSFAFTNQINNLLRQKVMACKNKHSPCHPPSSHQRRLLTYLVRNHRQLLFYFILSLKCTKSKHKSTIKKYTTSLYKTSMWFTTFINI